MTQNITPQSDLIIVGGGLNGPALALASANAGLNVTLIDSLPKDTRTSDVFEKVKTLRCSKKSTRQAITTTKSMALLKRS